MSRDHVHRFEDYALDTARGVLLRGGEEIALRPQSFEVLLYLVEHADRLVTREELLRAVWPGKRVTDASITQCLVDIRAALDDARHEKIRTLTRRGYRFELPVVSERVASPGHDAEGPARGNRRHRGRMGLAALAATGAALAAWWWFDRPGSSNGVPEEGTAPALATIAALPFENLAPGDQEDGFVTGFHDVLLTELGRYPGLRLIGRWSVESLGTDVRDPGTLREILGADLVLTGSVARDGTSVRFAFQLHDTASGEQTWAETYVEPLEASGLIALQHTVAGNVARGAGLAATGEASAPPDVPTHVPALQATHSLVAYERYLSGLTYTRRIESGEHDLDVLEAGRRELEAAIEADPDWAPPYAALGRMLHFVASSNTVPDAWRESRRLIDKALELDPDHAPALTSRGFLDFNWGRDFAAAESDFRQARALGDSMADWALGLLYGDLGRVDESLPYYRSALAADPLNPSIRRQYAVRLGCAGKYDAAAEQFAVLTRASDEPYFEVHLAYYEILAGRVGEGRARWDRVRDASGDMDGLILFALGDREAARAELERLASNVPLPTQRMALLALRLGQEARALAWLERRAETDPDSLWSLLCDKEMRALEGKPRFDRILEKLGYR